MSVSGALTLLGPGAATRPLAAKGFRPFFLLAALYAVGIVPLWLAIVGDRVAASPYLQPASWHAHEMLFGFATAVIAGFLLTAVANWTQRETLTGPPLLALAGLWVLGRAGFLFAAHLPRTLVALVDLAFLPLLMGVLARPLIATKNRRNFVMLAVLAALWLANLAMHLEASGSALVASGRATGLALDAVTLLMLIIAGRVVPMFTRNATGANDVRSLPRLDVATAAGMAVVLIVDVVAPGTLVAKLGAGAVGLLAALRSIHWGARRSLENPLLWILHVGHAWLAVGLVLRAVLVAFPSLPSAIATHAITVGALGSLTIGMMARVSLGHTGRLLVASRATEWAFSLMLAAAFARVAVPVLSPAAYAASLTVAGGLWSAAFAMFVVAYFRVLTSPRVDGRAG